MQQFQDGLGEAWTNVATFLPRLLGAIVILVIGYVVAKALEKMLDKVLERVGFDRWVERGGVKRALENSQYDASSLLGRLLFSIVMLFVLQLAFGVFGPNPISELLSGIISYLPRVFVAVLILVIGAAIANAVKDMVQGALGGLESGRTLALVASGAIMVVAVFAALDQLRIAPTIVSGLFYAMLAIIVGSAVIAFGGGGIPVARRYVERWSRRADRESQRIQQQTEGGGRASTEGGGRGSTEGGGRRSTEAPGSTAAAGRDRDIDLRDEPTRPVPRDEPRQF